MHYSIEESLSEVRSRGERVRRRRENRRIGWLSLAICSILLILTLAAASVPKLPPGSEGSAAMGAFLLSPEAEGFILAIVVAFVMGVTVTLLALQRRKTGPPEKKKQQTNDVEETT